MAWWPLTTPEVVEMLTPEQRRRWLQMVAHEKARLAHRLEGTDWTLQDAYQLTQMTDLYGLLSRSGVVDLSEVQL